jgi:hypothetical protein
MNYSKHTAFWGTRWHACMKHSFHVS